MRAVVGRLLAAHALCALVLVLSCAPAQAGVARPLPGGAFDVTTSGEQPDIAVDAEGTAHIVWNQAVEGGADILHYCRVLRTKQRCDVHHQLVPSEPEPQFNTDTSGPKVVLFGPEQIAVMTFRYPNVVTVGRDGTRDPDCFNNHPAPSDFCFGSSSKTYAFYSIDNGTTFGAEDVFSHTEISGDAIPLIADVPAGDGTPGFDQAPLIATITDTVSGGTYFASAPPFGYARDNANLGAEGPDRAYSGRLAADGDKTPVATFADLGSRIFLRRYGGTGPMNSVFNWPGANQVALGSDPRLAGGPGGVHLAYKPQGGTDYIVRRVNGVSVDGGVNLSDGGDTANPAIFADDGGTLHGAWVRRTATNDALRYRFALDGFTFSPPIRLAERASRSIWNVGVSAAEDGGGFAIFSSSLFGNGRISVVPFGSQRPRKLIDVRVSAIEITQAIQNEQIATRPQRAGTAANTLPYRGVPLAEGQTTVVRVYAKSRRGLRLGARRPAMTLRAFRNGQELAGPYLPDKVGRLPIGPGDDVTPAQRASATDAYTFTLPWQSSRGTLTLEAEINPAGLRPAAAECRRCRDDNKLRVTGIQFNPTRALTIVPISVTINGNKPAGFPDSSVPFAGVRAVTPLLINVPNYRTDIDVSDIQNIATVQECFLGLIPCTSSRAITLGEKTSMARERVHDWADDNQDSSQVFPVGVFPASQLSAGGSTSGGATNSDGKIYGDDQPVAIVADARPLTSTAHEIHHGLGRVHAGQTCGSNDNGQVGEPWPPNNDGALNANEFGLDQRTPAPFRPIVAGQTGQPATVFDFMSYCPVGGGANETNHWVSILNWTRVINEQRSGPVTARASAARSERVARVSAANPARAKSLRVVALIAADATPVIISVTPDDGAPTPDQGNGLRFVGRNEGGSEVATGGVVVREVHQDGLASSQVVSGRIPAAGVTVVDLQRDGQPIAERIASKNTPTVKITAPSSGSVVGGSGNVDVRWKAADKDGDPLLAIVAFSGDGGSSWRTVQVGPSKGRVAVPAALFSASRNARVRVRVQDGFHEALATSGRFRSRGAPPSVRITSPGKGLELVGGASLSLAGEAYGSAANKLTGRALTWRDGKRVIGRGERITVNGVAPGKRRITLTAREKGGPAGVAKLTVKVAAATPAFTVLTVPARLGRKARSLKITAATSFASTLKASGKRFRLDRKPRKISIPVKPGRGVLSLNLVLSAGKSRATELVRVPRR